MDERERRLRHEVADACHRLAAHGLVAGPDGNVTARLGADRLIATPAGASKGDVRVDDLVVVGLDGALLVGSRPPSSELAMHLRLYARRPDVHAVVHAHPPTATGWATAGRDFMAPVLPEVILQMGGVPLVPYATPGTEALPDAMEPWIAGHDAFLLANHGATTTGPTVEIALQRMESLEHAARILIAAQVAGGARALDAASVAALDARRTAARQSAAEDG